MDVYSIKKPDRLRLVRIISVIGITASIVFTLTAWNMGILTSRSAMEDFITGAGMFGPVLFVIIQIVQVIVPIIPGGVSCLVGVLMFGPIKGFIYNYVGICTGSMIAFWISRTYGRTVMESLFSENSIRKYEAWTDTKGRFAKLFTLAILFPVAPDDLLCFLAGTTGMTWKRFTAVIWLCKPAAIALYSMGLNAVYTNAISLFGGC